MTCWPVQPTSLTCRLWAPQLSVSSKPVTLSIPRCLNKASCAQACLNMRELLAGETAINRQQGCVVARIMLHARDAALSQSLQDAAARAGPGQTVAGVVGDAHMQGVCEHWHQSLHADRAGPGAVWHSGSRGSADGNKSESEKRRGASRAEAGDMGPSEDAGLMGMRVALAESVLSLQVRLVHLCFACTCLPSLCLAGHAPCLHSLKAHHASACCAIHVVLPVQHT